MRAYERFLKYVVINTRSDDTSGRTPSSDGQFDLARLLVEEMHQIGIADAYVDEKCYVYGSLPATSGYENLPCVMFCAHLDTAAFNGENVRPQLIGHYNGEDVPLGKSGKVLSPREFPDLKTMVGQTLIVTDGTTLLGADDKAGIAEIMTMAETVIREKRPHGRLAFSFPPDEEICAGAKDLDLEKLGADVGYTVDGGKLGMVQFENFNAALAKISIQGFGVHPGSAKDVMINALLVANELNNMLPSGDTPRDTSGYEGFFHVTKWNGTPDECTMEYIIRDHDRNLFEGRKKCMEHIAELLNDKYGKDTVKLTITDEYFNMAEVIKDHYELVEYAIQAVRMTGEKEIIKPIRGGTDGCQLSFRGLPCPDIGTGLYGAHGPFEHITVEAMDKVTQILLNVVQLFEEHK